ncbi:MAG: 1-(5-phosphoribosyl)-5-[(5-phosphoribosylamino)methylideneamino]imidazole-4-carboxamide isomerase [Alphaproteobacteria bacterium]|nr:1-(5-phosphoribosyl)-5-[(5-phosphoribosylamino)methylideneamino]imidazole-4-carboxamide isomerase [Alphaproteobacteria bacterium]
MILFPAIDLKGGKCVRLLRGDMASATVFNDDPGQQAQLFAAQGFSWIHVVDLDGAFAGSSVNTDAIRGVLSMSGLPVQLGGGIRSLAAIEHWLGLGVNRVILGTIAVTEPALVHEAGRLFPGRVVVGIDAREGRVAIQGWGAGTDVTAVELARRLSDAGIGAIIYTDIARDGTGLGLNLHETALVAEASPVPVIASGGVGSLADLEALKALNHPNIAGAVCGRALYDGRLDARAALAAMEA